MASRLRLLLLLLLHLVFIAVEHTHAFYLPGTQPVDFMPGDEVTLMVRHEHMKRRCAAYSRRKTFVVVERVSLVRTLRHDRH